MSPLLIAGLVGGTIIAGLGGALWLQTNRLESAQRSEAIAVETAKANALTISALQADRARADRVADTLAAIEADRNRALTGLRREIANVKPSTCPLPAVDVAADGLRKRSGDAPRGSAADRTGKPAVVPSKP